jgi:cobalamin synthase
MKFFSKQLGLFAALFTIYTIAFRYLLSNSLQNEQFNMVWIFAALYAAAIFITAWNLGKADGMKKIFFDAGLRFHVTNYLIFGIVSELWFFLGFNSDKESINIVHYTMFFWGLGLILHFIIFLLLRRNTIRGIQRSDIFD